MGIGGLISARDRLVRAIDAEADLAVTLDEAVRALHEITDFSACALMTTDPETLLPTGGVVEGFAPETCAPFWDIELLSPGFNKYTTLARSNDPVATLVDATDGDLDRSPVYTALYAPLGVVDELRAAFVVGTRCWGIVTLIRAAHHGPFADRDVDRVRQLAPLIGRALKTSACRLETTATGPAAMVVVDARNDIRDLTIEAADLLGDLHTGGLTEEGLPSIVAAAVTRARSSRRSTHVATRVRGTSGRWMRVTAVPMASSDGSVAIMIEPARPSDLTPILLESYGLTDREVETVMLLARGLSTKDVSTELTLSPHTVRDHIKAIFAKVGVGSRGELFARLFFEHMIDGLHTAVHRTGA